MVPIRKRLQNVKSIYGSELKNSPTGLTPPNDGSMNEYNDISVEQTTNLGLSHSFFFFLRIAFIDFTSFVFVSFMFSQSVFWEVKQEREKPKFTLKWTSSYYFQRKSAIFAFRVCHSILPSEWTFIKQIGCLTSSKN